MNFLVEFIDRVKQIFSTDVLFTVSCCSCAVGVGIYGNVETNKGIGQFKSSVTDAEVTIQEVQDDVSCQ